MLLWLCLAVHVCRELLTSPLSGKAWLGCGCRRPHKGGQASNSLVYGQGGHSDCACHKGQHEQPLEQAVEVEVEGQGKAVREDHLVAVNHLKVHCCCRPRAGARNLRSSAHISD